MCVSGHSKNIVKSGVSNLWVTNPTGPWPNCHWAIVSGWPMHKQCHIRGVHGPTCTSVLGGIHEPTRVSVEGSCGPIRASLMDVRGPTHASIIMGASGPLQHCHE